MGAPRDLEPRPRPDRIICVGHRFRRDDGVGPWIADRLRAHGLDVLELSGEGAELIDAMAGAVRVILVDATQSGAPPGTVRYWDAAANPLPAGLFRYSTHLFGVAEAIETARALGRLPRFLEVHGVEGAGFDFGEGLSPAVEAAAVDLAETLTAALTAPPGPAPDPEMPAAGG